MFCIKMDVPSGGISVIFVVFLNVALIIGHYSKQLEEKFHVFEFVSVSYVEFRK
jgi:hypothetical protein